MAGRYEAVKPPRFEVEQGLGGERISVRVRRTIYAAQGLGEAEGRMIVERLLRHLPRGAGS